LRARTRSSDHIGRCEAHIFEGLKKHMPASKHALCSGFDQHSCWVFVGLEKASRLRASLKNDDLNGFIG
jgi:hypothetical protein